jgi:acetyltransferase AlgX (SGNH hydrolase-like protein)
MNRLSSIFSSEGPLLRVGTLIPWLIALCCSLEVASRFVPVESFAFRAWEPMRIAPAPTGPFAANKTYVNPFSYGDLANLGHVRAPREYRYERFTTDAYGFRNPPELTSGKLGPVEAILIGESFAVGSGVADDQTLAAQIRAIGGHLTYNAGATSTIFLDDIRTIARRLNMRRGVVVYELLERQVPYDVASSATARLYKDGPPAPAPSRLDWLERWWAAASISRTAVLVAKLRSLYSDAQDEGSPLVANFHLDNGQRMLFHTGIFWASDDAQRRISPDYWVWLSAQLAKDHLKLVVLLVPEKLTVYQRHLTDSTAPKTESPALDQLERDLASAGVPVVNLRESFRARATQDMADRKYLYFLDDTHWNARGIGIAARALSAHWPQ